MFVNLQPYTCTAGKTTLVVPLFFSKLIGVYCKGEDETRTVIDFFLYFDDFECYVLRKPANNITKVALRWTPEGKRKPGRPKNTWRRTVEKK
jgi:hypothetical protein